jgi:hypothetical protein
MPPHFTSRIVLSALAFVTLAIPALAADGKAAPVAPVAPVKVTPVPPAAVAQPVAPIAVAPATQPFEDQVELLIAQALDQKTSIELKDVPIRDAIKKIAEQTGIPIEMSLGTVRFLPYGSETKVTASIQGRPLRECLIALIQPIGLQFSVDRDVVEIEATPPLSRMANRASWAELAKIEMLYNHAWSQELFDSLKIQFQDSSSDDLNVNRETLRKLASGVGAGSAADVLEHATAQYGWTWYVAEDHIVILSRPRQIERQLERRVSVQYKNSNLKDALLDLADQAGVLLRFDPGALGTLPSPIVDQFTFAIENASVRQALEVIAGQTGLSYFIEPDGIRLTTANAPQPGMAQSSMQVADTAAATVAAMRSNSIVGQVAIPAAHAKDVQVSFFVRENDLTPEVNELRKTKVKEAVQQMRSALATQPKD